ncbi:MAG: hypothetical protein LBH72_05655, partial [Proteiniphilum sp.]|nr:hypothetical protein [Proteiniphilum sp.]
PYTRIKDTRTRLEQYLHSIDYAIRKYRSIHKVVFVENTNFPYDYSALCHLAENCRKTLEVLSFQGDTEKTVLHGKGFGEIECINHALENSRLLKSSDSFVKLTGRVIVLNFDRVMRSACKRNSFYAITGKKIPYVETILYRAEKTFFQENLHDVGHFVFDREGIIIEHIFYRRLHELAEHSSIGSFGTYRFLEGISGGSGASYATKWPDKIEKTIAALFRKFDINRQ